jgi:predicted nuclease of restriction endonuclease-like (RecB) superfamily
MDNRFVEVIQLIKQSRFNAIRAVNSELILLYWNIGSHVSKKIENSEWGASVVDELANFIQKNEPELKGLSNKNIWRMRQFYDTYKGFPKLSPLVREISWTNNMLIFSRCKSIEEIEFYLHLTSRENYSKRELDRQISASLFERSMMIKSIGHQGIQMPSNELTDKFRDDYVLSSLTFRILIAKLNCKMA